MRVHLLDRATLAEDPTEGRPTTGVRWPTPTWKIASFKGAKSSGHSSRTNVPIAPPRARLDGASLSALATVAKPSPPSTRASN
ncbi:MAG: hypothetical protein R3B99_06005 [Polyangiales bacterium]